MLEAKFVMAASSALSLIAESYPARSPTPKIVPASEKASPSPSSEYNI